jgi:hypothetical protein
MEIIFAKSAAKHGVSKADVIKIMGEKPGTKIGLSKESLNKLAWISRDNFNQWIEIIAIDFLTFKYVIHAMPVSKRGGKEDDQLEGLW